MNEQLLLNLIQRGEGPDIDFKRKLDLDSARGKAEFIKDIISLANSASHFGYLLIGINDDKSIAGTNELDDDRIQHIASKYITPPLNINVYTLKPSFAYQQTICIVEVGKQKRPHKICRDIENLVQNDVFIRRGSVVMKASPEEIVQMANEETWSIESLSFIKAAKRHTELGNYDSALAAYSKAIEIAPSAILFLSRGTIYFKYLDEKVLNQNEIYEMGDKALKDFSDALLLGTNSEEIKQAKMGRVHAWANHYPNYREKDRELWIEDIEWLQENMNDNELGKLRYYEVLMGENNVGIDDDPYWLNTLNESISLGFSEPDVFRLRGIAHFYHHNYGLAIEDLSKSQGDLSGERLQSVLLFKATIFARIGQYDQSYALFKHVLVGEKDWLGYLEHDFQVDILCRCGLVHQFGGVDKDEEKIIVELVNLLKPWARITQKQHPRLARKLENILTGKI